MFQANGLPSLPKLRNNQETKFSLKFKKWIEENPRLSSSHELKDTRGENQLLFSEVKQAQLDYGMAVKSDKGVLIRVIAIHGGEPDYIWLRNAPAYIEIKYPNFFCLIDVETFILEKERSKSKSLSASRARAIATTVI